MYPTDIHLTDKNLTDLTSLVGHALTHMESILSWDEKSVLITYSKANQDPLI